MKQGKWEVLSIRENQPIIPNLFPRSLRLLSGAEPEQRLPGQVTEIHSRVRYLKGRINTESVLPHAAQTMGWWNRWKWTFVGVGKRRQRYGKRKRPALKRTRMVSHLLRADLACSVLSPRMFILSPLPHIIRLIMPSYTWFICHPPPLRASTAGKHKCTKLYKWTLHS